VSGLLPADKLGSDVFMISSLVLRSVATYNDEEIKGNVYVNCTLRFIYLYSFMLISYVVTEIRSTHNLSM